MQRAHRIERELFVAYFKQDLHHCCIEEGGPGQSLDDVDVEVRQWCLTHVCIVRSSTKVWQLQMISLFLLWLSCHLSLRHL